MPVPPLDYASAERQTLDEILDWHQGVVEVLVTHRASLLRAMRDGLAVAPRFMAMTEGEVDAYHDAQRGELDRLAMLNLVACAEAEITIDYFRRVGKQLKDELSRAYRKMHEKLLPTQQIRPPFDGAGILGVLKAANVMDNNIVGQYRECLAARHWIGHGRRWEKPIAVEKFDPIDVHERCRQLLQALPK